MVVAMIKSWDGTRVLGVFDNESTALEKCKKIVDINSEEFSLDFVVMNKISMCQSLEVSSDDSAKAWRRRHIYDEAS